MAAEFSMIGFLDSTNVGIIGLYMAIMITVGGVVRQFLLPKVGELMWEMGKDVRNRYTNIPDPTLLLNLVHSEYMSRYGNYKCGSGEMDEE